MESTAQGQIAAENNAGKVPIRDYQLFQLNIVREYVRICEENGLRYWAAYGTLLGAARHEGFIPWDDDIDFFMPPSDYYRFREICKSDLSEGFYFQAHSENPCNYINWQRIGVKNSTSLLKAHADIHAEWGICIDVFPISPCPAPGTKDFENYLKTLKKFNRTTKKYVYKHDAQSLSGLSKLYHLFMAAESDERNVRRWLNLEDKLLNHAPFEESEYCFDITDPFVFRTEWFEGEIDRLPFEGLLLPAPKRYKEILNAVYGDDWAELPPEEKRTCHNGGGSEEVIVSLTEPYTKYLR